MNEEAKYCPFCGCTTIIKWRTKVNKNKKYKCIRCGKEFTIE